VIGNGVFLRFSGTASVVRLPSHRRGHWFDPSIAHLRKAPEQHKCWSGGLSLCRVRVLLVYLLVYGPDVGGGKSDGWLDVGAR
jgi:hypothetical protein